MAWQTYSHHLFMLHCSVWISLRTTNGCSLYSATMTWMTVTYLKNWRAVCAVLKHHDEEYAAVCDGGCLGQKLQQRPLSCRYILLSTIKCCLGRYNKEKEIENWYQKFPLSWELQCGNDISFNCKGVQASSKQVRVFPDLPSQSLRGSRASGSCHTRVSPRQPCAIAAVKQH